MKNKIVLGLLASTMMVSAASAGLISNGGKPQYSITEIQTKIDDGSFYNYAGVVKLINGVRVGGGGKYLFTKTFAPGMALPEITDYAALKRALAKKDETVLVASNEWILPIPAVFVELGKQNGVSGAEFMAHYLEATAGISQDDFAAYAIAQTKAVLGALGVNTVAVDTIALVDAGILTELAAERLNSAMLSNALTDAKGIIEGLDMDLQAKIGELATVSAELTTLKENIDVTASLNVRGINPNLTAIQQVEALGTEISRLRGLVLDARADIRDARRDAGKFQSTGSTVSITDETSPVSFTQDGITFTTTERVRTLHVNGVKVGPAGNTNYAKVTTNAAGEVVDVNPGRSYYEEVSNPTVGDLNVNTAVSNLQWSDLSAEVFAGIEAAVTDAYNDGYDHGYADGYADGFADGVNSVSIN